MFKNSRISAAFSTLCFVLLIFSGLAFKCNLDDQNDTNRQPAPGKTGRTKATVVLLVRHAEKAAEPENDPELSVTGQVRALHLAQLLENKNIGAIFVTSYRRTQETADPLASKLGLTPNVSNDPNAIAEAIISEHEGETVLVVGHTDTIPQTIRQLGGNITPIADSEFDNMFIVTIPANDSATKVERTKY